MRSTSYHQTTNRRPRASILLIVNRLRTTLRGRARTPVLWLTLILVCKTTVADVVAVVSSKSAVVGLSKSQTEDIFLGRASRFPNGTDAIPLDQAESAVARDEFYAKVAGRSAAQMKAYWSKIIFTGRGQPPKQAASAAEVKKRVAARPTVIGYIDASLVDDTVRVVF